jgi:DNA-binding NarL/FixJ family response regulator
MAVLADDEMGAARAVVVAARPGVRAVVRESLHDTELEVVAETANSDATIDAVLTHRPDLVLLDVAIPGGGITTAARIREEAPAVAVVMLSGAVDDEQLFGALRAGAVGYLLNDTDPTRLAPALRGVLAGEAAVPRRLMAKVIRELQGRRRTDAAGLHAVDELSPREREVLELLKSGQSTSEVAAALHMAPVTVRTHVAAALRKLGVADREAGFAALDADEG